MIFKRRKVPMDKVSNKVTSEPNIEEGVAKNRHGLGRRAKIIIAALTLSVIFAGGLLGYWYLNNQGKSSDTTKTDSNSDQVDYSKMSTEQYESQIISEWEKKKEEAIKAGDKQAEENAQRNIDLIKSLSSGGTQDYPNTPKPTSDAPDITQPGESN